MSEKTSNDQANPVSHGGDHDRVQMLSLRADGTPDQHDPEVIGDVDVAVKAAKTQFVQQAVSAVDTRKQNAGDSRKAQEKAAEAAEKAAEKVIKSLHREG